MRIPSQDDNDDRDVPSLEKRETLLGGKPGDRRVRIVRPGGDQFRREAGHYVATDKVFVSRGLVPRALARLQRVLIGKRLDTAGESEERVSVTTGLPILASDNISSSAYATEEAMRVLAVAGLAALSLTMPIAIAVVVVLAIVVMSQSQVIRFYPNGGGSYVVARENHGVVASLITGAALLIDYVLTVSVSVAAGVAAITSFAPDLHDSRVLVALGIIAMIALANLRGVREAGLVFAAPTYAYIVAMAGLIGYGFFRLATGDIPLPARAPEPFPEIGAEALGVMLVLRAFASGSVGLTGSEAVANGVPSFRAPERRNALITLVLMGTIFGSIFLALTFLATSIGIQPDAHELETVNSLLTRSIVGDGSPYYYVVQFTTAIILLLAANTAYTGFPRLASVLANDRFMPRHFADLGSRLAFNFGIIVLSCLAGLVLTAFGGSVTALVPLYTIGVFLAFTMSQSGLARRSWRERYPGWQFSIALNIVGTAVTSVVLIVVAVTKFALGAWMVLLVLPVLVALLYAIRIHYREAHDALMLSDFERPVPQMRPPVLVVPVARIDRAALQAIAFARSLSKNLKAVHIATSPESADEFERRWKTFAPDVSLDVILSPYRSLVVPLLRYVDALDKSSDQPITVVLSEFVPRHWWEWLLHSQTATRLKAALLFRPNTIIIDVPYHFQDTADLARRRQ